MPLSEHEVERLTALGYTEGQLRTADALGLSAQALWEACRAHPSGQVLDDAQALLLQGVPPQDGALRHETTRELLGLAGDDGEPLPGAEFPQVTPDERDPTRVNVVVRVAVNAVATPTDVARAVAAQVETEMRAALAGHVGAEDGPEGRARLSAAAVSVLQAAHAAERVRWREGRHEAASELQSDPEELRTAALREATTLVQELYGDEEPRGLQARILIEVVADLIEHEYQTLDHMDEGEPRLTVAADVVGAVARGGVGGDLDAEGVRTLVDATHARLGEQGYFMNDGARDRAFAVLVEWFGRAPRRVRGVPYTQAYLDDVDSFMGEAQGGADEAPEDERDRALASPNPCGEIPLGPEPPRFRERLAQRDPLDLSQEHRTFFQHIAAGLDLPDLLNPTSEGAEAVEHATEAAYREAAQREEAALIRNQIGQDPTGQPSVAWAADAQERAADQAAVEAMDGVTPAGLQAAIEAAAGSPFLNRPVVGFSRLRQAALENRFRDLLQRNVEFDAARDLYREIILELEPRRIAWTVARVYPGQNNVPSLAATQLMLQLGRLRTQCERGLFDEDGGLNASALQAAVAEANRRTIDAEQGVEDAVPPTAFERLGADDD